LIWTATALTLFPEMFPGPLGASLSGRGLQDGKWALETVDIRDFARDKHRTVDDTPFGGGAGMVMRADVVDEAMSQAIAERPGAKPIYLTPRGRLLDQAKVRELAGGPGVILLCGRYEGVDQRVLDAHEMEEISLGDFILSGGEAAAITLIDACVRLLPGVTGNQESLEEESFEMGLLEYPHYTRPAEWQAIAQADGQAGEQKKIGVPEVLLSGHHKNIEAWRQRQAEEITKLRRPDLWERYVAKKTK
jgi:tRNA (guanine37-N1)-methyltransferase